MCCSRAGESVNKVVRTLLHPSFLFISPHAWGDDDDNDDTVTAAVSRVPAMCQASVCSTIKWGLLLTS